MIFSDTVVRCNPCAWFISNNKYAIRQTWQYTKWSECSLFMGTICSPLQLILCLIVQLAHERVFSLMEINFKTTAVDYLVREIWKLFPLNFCLWTHLFIFSFIIRYVFVLYFQVRTLPRERTHLQTASHPQERTHPQTAPHPRGAIHPSHQVSPLLLPTMPVPPQGTQQTLLTQVLQDTLRQRCKEGIGHYIWTMIHADRLVSTWWLQIARCQIGARLLTATRMLIRLWLCFIYKNNVKIGTICRSRDLWKLARIVNSCVLLCPPD